AEIEQLVSDRVHRWLLDPGSIYKSISARLPDASTQQRLVARAADIGKHWPELPVARKRAVLTGLIERLEVSVDQIDIRLRSSRPPQLSRAGYHASDPRWAAAARFDGGEAPRALPSAACLARSADRARL